MSAEMAAAVFCLAPAGDTCVTSRLYAAIAAGCIPVVICDPLHGAFPSHTRYADFWVKVRDRARRQWTRRRLWVI